MSLPEFPDPREWKLCGSPVRRRLMAALGGMVGGLALGGAGAAGAAGVPRVRIGGAAGGTAAKEPQGTSQGGSTLGGYVPLDAEWVRRQGNELGVYARYIQALRLRNISVMQVVAAHAKKRGSVWNSLPPRAYWRCIGPTLKLLDRVSIELNVPVTEVVSVYRAPAYNALCPGARSGSWHQRNFAVDVKMGTAASNVAAMARRMRDRGWFRGGVGRYGGFTHVDTRGTNVDW